MNRWTRIVAVLGAVSLIAAGCGTAGENPLAPDERASRNSGGFGTGSNDTGGDTPTTQTTDTEVAPSDSTTRSGGFGTGSN